METGLMEKLTIIQKSLPFFIPEIILSVSILFLLVLGMIYRKHERAFLFHIVCSSIFFLSVVFVVLSWKGHATPVRLFGDMLRTDDFSGYLKILIDISGLFTVLMTWRGTNTQKHLSEYYALIIAAVLGAHLLLMSVNFTMVFLSLEVISISSYILTGFSFTKKGAEGSLKYFLYGSVASAIMLYGLSILYGLSGTLDFSSSLFLTELLSKNTPLMFTASLMVLAGFFYKMAAVPMHPWVPDIYEASTTPVVAFFSVVPKLAGLGVLTKFLIAVNVFGHMYDWYIIIAIASGLSLAVGNFSALKQKSPKRMMAYSSIAQSGFLLIGVASHLQQGIHFMLFYATIYAMANFLVFFCLNYFEHVSINTIEGFAGAGKSLIWPSVLITVGFVSLTGLPPTAGFTAKLFVFSSLWEAYTQSGKIVLLLLLFFGLLNTVISLFFYLRIPYFAFLKSGQSLPKGKNFTVENLLGLILVMMVLILFFLPGLLMGWINKINFVL